jgi:hypothetical protein
MKTFEEKWTAWLDGQLSGKELTDFEASLPDLAAAQVEKRDALRLGAFLKEQLATQTLSNEEFFSHQVREQIARDTPERSRSRSTWWTVPRLVWCGATALALFVLTTVVLMNQHPAGEQSEYLTQILNSRVDPGANPNATISIFESKNDNKDKVTVLWTEGLQTLPADYAAK